MKEGPADWINMSEKRSRRLSRKEIAVAIILIAVIGISYGVYSLDKSYKAEQRELFWDSVKNRSP